MENQQPNAPHLTYLRQMIEVKRRFRAVDRILGAKKPLSGNTDYDNECAFLQVRRVVELITFSAIISDEARYKRSREIDKEINPKESGDYTSDWNAATILVKLSKISPHFLPRPLGKMTVQSDGVKHFNEASAKLTHDRLIAIYKTASGYAHTTSPFKFQAENIEREKKEVARFTITKELKFLKSVIWDHVKIGLIWQVDANPLELENSDTAWLVWFGDHSTDNIQMSLASAIQE